ncbi:MAG: MFS transporter [Nitrososphaerota archaeon]|nr:MFS transporter [Nitrososphaerota archaeon]
MNDADQLKGTQRVALSGEFKRHLTSSFIANLILPIFYLFLPLLAYRLGASVFEIGLVGGASNAVYSFLPFVMGHYSDRQGARKFFIALSFATLSIVSILYTVIANPIALIVARMFEGIGWAMLWPAVEAAISNDVSGDSKRSLSIFNLTWSFAAAIGPLVGAALIFLVSIRFAFIVTSIILLGTLVLNLYPIFSKSTQSDPPPRTGYSEQPSYDTSAPLPQIRASFYLISTALAAVSSGVLFTFFSPYARSIGISILLIGVITFVYGFARFFVYVLTVKVRFRAFILNPSYRKKNMIAALVLMSLSSLLLLAHDSTGLIYLAAYAIVGAGYSVIYAVSQAALVAETTPEKAGKGAGLFESSIGVGSSLGPVVAGLISGSSLTTPFLLPSISLVVLLAILPFASRKKTA